jgi:serine protease Do
VVRGWLGVLIQEITTELAESFGLDRPRGALVSQVIADSPAARADLQAGDIIVAFNSILIETSSDLPPLVARVRPGQEASVTVIRGAQELTLSVTIEELPENPGRRAAAPVKPKANPFKVSVEPLSEAQIQDGISGVVVTDVQDGPAAEAGIQSGDIIQRINDQVITNRADFERALQDIPTGKPVPVLVKRGDGSLFLPLTVPE